VGLVTKPIGDLGAKLPEAESKCYVAVRIFTFSCIKIHDLIGAGPELMAANWVQSAWQK